MTGFGTNVRPRKMADLIADRIRRLIANGELADGEWLPTEPQLMREFGVSRPTLREAFRLLEADALVTIRRGPPGGARVTLPGPAAAAARFGMLLTLSGTTLHDVHEARMLIEPPAARRLAERGTAADRRQLATTVDELRATIDDRPTFGRLATAFHVDLVHLSGNTTLATFVGVLVEITNGQLARVYRESTAEQTAADNRRALRSIEKVVELVNAKDGQGAEKFWNRHMRALGQYLLQDSDAQPVDLLD